MILFLFLALLLFGCSRSLFCAAKRVDSTLRLNYVFQDAAEVGTGIARSNFIPRLAVRNCPAPLWPFVVVNGKVTLYLSSDHLTPPRLVAFSMSLTYKCIHYIRSCVMCENPSCWNHYTLKTRIGSQTVALFSIVNSRQR